MSSFILCLMKRSKGQVIQVSIYRCDFNLLWEVKFLWEKLSGDSRNFSQGIPWWACSVTIFFSSDSLLHFFFFLKILVQFFYSFFYLLESNVMNTVLDPVSVCLVKQNISIPIYFDVPFQGVSRFLKKIKNNTYLYFLI